MTDKLIMNNYLLIIKSTIEVYVHGTLEASNKDIKDLLNDSLEETIRHQEHCYNEMVSNGWYDVNNVDKRAIKQLINKIKKN